MGTLVKRMVCQQQGLDPGRVYHTAVMPCYDKKLEASRSDFNLPGPLSSVRSFVRNVNCSRCGSRCTAQSSSCQVLTPAACPMLADAVMAAAAWRQVPAARRTGVHIPCLSVHIRCLSVRHSSPGNPGSAFACGLVTMGAGRKQAQLCRAGSDVAEVDCVRTTVEVSRAAFRTSSDRIKPW